MIDPASITGYHAHVYYDATGRDAARALCEATAERFGLSMGRMHEREVGPHPRWSCQLAFAPEAFGQVVPWLALNRGDLNVFVHLLTGDDLLDHTQGQMWLGHSETLKLEMFESRS